MNIDETNTVNNDVVDNDDVNVVHVPSDVLPGQKSIAIPKKGDSTYKLIGNDEWRKGVVHSISGKAGGKYDACRNIQNIESGSITSHNFDEDVEEIPNTGQTQLNTRWVITSKTLQDGTPVTKARLVVNVQGMVFYHT